MSSNVEILSGSGSGTSPKAYNSDLTKLVSKLHRTSVDDSHTVIVKKIWSAALACVLLVRHVGVFMYLSYRLLCLPVLVVDKKKKKIKT